MAHGIGLSPAAYKFICALLYEHSRIFLGPSKQQLVSSRLASRLKTVGVGSFDHYCAFLNNNRDEIEVLVDLIATSHTYFFREQRHFDALTAQLLPDLLQQVPDVRNGLRCWSAAAASGEEAFSLAITLAEYNRVQPPVKWRIYGTDISRRALEIARRAIYATAKVRLPAPSLMQRYFQKGSGPYEGQCRIKDDLISKVTFAHANLFQAVYPVPQPQHIIFCRNALIYFDPPSRAQLIKHLLETLLPRGYLVIGLSDSLHGIPHSLDNLGGGIFRRAK